MSTSASGNPVVGKRSRRQSGEPVADPDEHFPACRRFIPPTQLPSYRGVIGRIRCLTAGGKQNMSTKEAVREVSKEIETSYCNATVYSLELRAIERSVTKLYDDFKEGRKRYAAGKTDKQGNDLPAVTKYKDLIAKKDMLFDCSTTDPDRKQKCSELWGVKMGEMEKRFLEDQRGDRMWHTQNQPDPVWYRAAMLAKRMQEKSVENLQDQIEARDHGKTFQQLEQNLSDQGLLPSASSPESCASTPVKSHTVTPAMHHPGETIY